MQHFDFVPLQHESQYWLKTTQSPPSPCWSWTIVIMLTLDHHQHVNPGSSWKSRTIITMLILIHDVGVHFFKPQDGEFFKAPIGKKVDFRGSLATHQIQMPSTILPTGALRFFTSLGSVLHFWLWHVGAYSLVSLRHMEPLIRVRKYHVLAYDTRFCHHNHNWKSLNISSEISDSDATNAASKMSSGLVKNI